MAAMSLALATTAATATAAPASSTTTATTTQSTSTPATTVPACDQTVAPGTATCYALRRTNGVHPSVAPDATPSGYGPSSLLSAYNLTSAAGGSGETVGIVDAYDDPNAESDLATYRSQYGLAACTTANGCFKKVNESGSTSGLPTADSGWAGEISLDVDMVSAICPKCHVLLVEATSASIADLGTSVNTAVSLGAKFVSNSYGGSEDGSESSSDSSYYHHAGVAVTASTGDSGYGISYPASSPYVTAVGGTSLSTASNTRGWSETAWTDAGSGCSSDEAKPSFQSGVTTGCTRRADADVSAVADPNTGVAVYQTYGASGWQVYGGTSVSSPVIASVYALAGTPGSSDTPAAYPYSHTGNLNDVTSGSNGSCSTAVLCTAGTGWDGPTGLGTPNGTAAFTTGGGGTSPVSVTNPGSQSGTVGTAASLQLSASGGTAPYTWTASGLPTGLSISSSGLVSGTPTTAGTYSVTATATDSTSATGATTFSWTISSSGGGGGCTAGQLLGNPGFETGSASPWTASSGVINSDVTDEPAHSGKYDSWLDGYGSTHTDTLSQSVTIPTGCSASLSFYLHIDTSETTKSTAYDTLTVTVGSTTVATYSNLNAASGYTLRTVNVSSFAGQTVAVKFTGKEDSSLQTSFVIDDTALNVS
ncbi:MAG TPA: putative Ig domain-containing protein [Pseudonocardiaceae bacterium]|nr:putative Ig domain-containing protein [Pseudonocardiaceae bacterium]